MTFAAHVAIRLPWHGPCKVEHPVGTLYAPWLADTCCKVCLPYLGHVDPHFFVVQPPTDKIMDLEGPEPASCGHKINYYYMHGYPNTFVKLHFRPEFPAIAESVGSSLAVSFFFFFFSEIE